MTASLAATRLTGQRSTEFYRALLQALSYPGRIVGLPTEAATDVPPSAWLPLALADVDIPIASDNAATAALIADATGAPIVSIESAWVLSITAPTPELLAQVNVGTALTPEDGARVGLDVTSLTPEDDSSEPGCTLRLTGPGVDGAALITVSGLDPTVAAQIGRASGSFPTGFDTWLFTPVSVVAISRSTTVEVQTSTSPPSSKGA